MVRATNIVGVRGLHSRRSRLIVQPLARSYVSDLAWRVTHALGEMLAFLWGIGALSAVGLFVAGIFG